MTKAAKPMGGKVQRDDPRVRKLLASLAADPALAPVVAEYSARQTAGGRKAFGSNALKAGGKLFALFTQGTLVVKLPKARVNVLVAEGVGVLFDPGHGRLMKEWLTVTRKTADWEQLVREAWGFSAGK
jgi:hypothetical protein